MPEAIPPNTYDITAKFRVTLPGNETPAQQDITLLLTGECWDPWPGVQIHDITLESFSPIPAE